MGIITAEAALYGLTNGLVLIGMYSIFTTLNQVLPIRALVGLIPQAYQPVAVVTTIAITFIPSTQRQFQAIKEAQAIRGQRLSGMKDWLPLFIPLLIGGLERAMQIAEAMTARGFISQTEKPTRTKRLLLILSLSLVVLGWIIQLNPSFQLHGWVILSSGVLIFLLLIIFSGKINKRTRFTQEKWNWTSSLITASSLVSILGFLAPLPGYLSLTYNPYPFLVFPELGIVQLFALCLILMPLFFQSGGLHVEY